ncbi:hypothetical protein [Phaeodactylibacter luteus]|uniref:Outer membrane protein beta-barrel domain-containing protein n=1 Tax=Phaeodactylibacter luteus TaxID=1564516 RepID=A0A5C6RGV7_9BACT|nr:hypothetical protein [Phaeodactylibacter luteus]TXB60553.1 hypothetical protein FRY97_20525 [Phaeodactylibacter luteus]
MPLARFLVFLHFVALHALSASAQTGLNARYAVPAGSSAAFTDASGQEASYYQQAYSFGLDYWIPLGQARIDLLPELNYAFSSHQPAFLPGLPATYRQQWLSFFANLNIYPFDLQGDCDCPTFSKSGNTLQKGFFLQASPGVTAYQSRISGQSPAGGQEQQWSTSWSAGLAAGIDFGLSDFVTLSPMIGYRYFHRHSVAIVKDSPEGPVPDFDPQAISHLWAGLRLGFRFDQR